MNREIDSYGEQEFPIGTLVVCTYARPDHWAKLGQVYEIRSEPFIWWSGGKHPDGARLLGGKSINGMKVQQIGVKWVAEGMTKTVHPVAWLRKLEDPDGDQQEHDRRYALPKGELLEVRA